MKKRWISIALALLMVMSLLPFAASAADGELLYKVEDGAAIVTGYSTDPVGKIVIPETLGGAPVKEIDADAFQDCKKLTEVVLPDGLEKIGDCAFRSSGLQKIDFPTSVKWFGREAFLGTELVNLVISNKQALRFDATFAAINTLKTVTIQSVNYFHFTYIPPYTFQYCSNLEAVSICENINPIQWDAFDGCIRLKDVYYNWDQEHWDEIDIESGNEPLKNATLHCNWEGPIPTPTPAPTAKPEVKNPFKDVVKDQYYYEPVLWAVNHDPQITAGTSATTFSPAATCTRGQVVTFLWRAAGCPEPQSTKNPFTDVKASDYFFKAVLWAAEKGITAGTSATTFAPGAPCTRAHVVTFLWRANEKPAASGKNPFSDVKDGEYYTDAVLWAVSKNITQGTSATTFSPANPCTRGQIMTFLYRDMK